MHEPDFTRNQQRVEKDRLVRVAGKDARARLSVPLEGPEAEVLQQPDGPGAVQGARQGGKLALPRLYSNEYVTI